MKRFAVILIIAVLALGCVFAATGDSQRTSSNSVNDGHKFYVETTIGTVYPVYQIVGTGNNSVTVTSAKDDKSNKVVAKLSSDGKSVSVDVALQQFGMKDNDITSTTATKTTIRWYGNVTVTITASKLTNSVTTSGHTQASDAPALTGFTAVESLSNVTIEDATATASTGYTADALKLTYNGKVVSGSDSAQTVANGGFTWNIENLTAGDTYTADVVITYTNEN